MPIKIETYRSRAKQAALPGVRQGGPAPGGALASVGHGVEELASGINKAVVAQTERIDSAALMDAARQVEVSWQQRQMELEQHKGKDAGAYADTAMEQWQKDLGQVEQTLNPRQRAAFARMKAEKSSAWSAHVRRYVGSEGDRYAAESYEALGKVNAQNAMLAARSGDTKRVDELLALQNQAIEQRSTTEGWGEDQLAAERIGRLTPMHAGVVEAMAENGANSAARDYLGKHRADIDAGVAQKLEDMLGKKDVAALSLSIALSMRRSKDVQPNEFEYNLTAAMSEIEKIADIRGNPELYDAVRQRLEADARMVDSARRQNDGEKLGRLGIALQTTSRVDQTSDDFLTLSSQGKEAILSAQRVLRRKKGGGGKAISRANRSAQEMFRGLPTEEQLDFDADADPRLNDAEPWVRDWVKGQKKTIQKQWDRDHGATYSDIKSRVKAMAQLEDYSNGVRADYEAEIDQEIDEWMATNPDATVIPGEEARKIIDASTKAVAIPGRIYGTRKVPRWKAEQMVREGKLKKWPAPAKPSAPPEPKAAADVPEPSLVPVIPDEDLAEIADALRRHGKAPTQEEIERLWRLKNQRTQPSR